MLKIVKVDYMLGNCKVEQETYVEGSNKNKMLEVSFSRVATLTSDYEDLLAECESENFDVSSATKNSVKCVLSDVEEHLEDIRCAEANLQDEIQYFEYASQIMNLRRLVEKEDLEKFDGIAERVIEKTNALTESISILSEMEEDAEKLLNRLVVLSEKLI